MILLQPIYSYIFLTLIVLLLRKRTLALSKLQGIGLKDYFKNRESLKFRSLRAKRKGSLKNILINWLYKRLWRS